MSAITRHRKTCEKYKEEQGQEGECICERKGEEGVEAPNVNHKAHQCTSCDKVRFMGAEAHCRQCIAVSKEESIMKEIKPNRQEDGEVTITLPFAIDPVNLVAVGDSIKEEDWDTAIEMVGAGITNALSVETKDSNEARREMVRMRNHVEKPTTMDSTEWRTRMAQTLEAMRLTREGLKKKPEENGTKEQEIAKEKRERRKEWARHKIGLAKPWIAKCGKGRDREWVEQKMQEQKPDGEKKREKGRRHSGSNNGRKTNRKNANKAEPKGEGTSILQRFAMERAHGTEEKGERIYEAREVYKGLTMTWLKVYEDGGNLGWTLSWSSINETADIIQVGCKTYAIESALNVNDLPEEGNDEMEVTTVEKTQEEIEKAIESWRSDMRKERDVRVDMENAAAMIVVSEAIKEIVGARRSRRIREVLGKIEKGSSLRILRNAQLWSQRGDSIKKKIIIAQMAQNLTHIAEWAINEPITNDETKGEEHHGECRLRSIICSVCNEEESAILHEIKGCYCEQEEVEREEVEKCGCVRTNYARKLSYEKMTSGWTKGWSKEVVRQWDPTKRNDKEKREARDSRSSLDWNARIDFYRIARMMESCDLQGGLKTGLKEKAGEHTEKEENKVRARVLAKSMEEEDWNEEQKEDKDEWIQGAIRMCDYETQMEKWPE